MPDLTGDQTTKLQRRLEEYVGSLASLTTTAQSNIVDAVNEVASEASDANSYAAVAMSKASDASSYAALNSAAASQADSVAHVASAAAIVNASAASDAMSAAVVAQSKASDASSAAIVAQSKASDASSFAVLNSAAASQADSVAHVASAAAIVNASAASDAMSAAVVAQSKASDASSFAVLNSAAASQADSVAHVASAAAVVAQSKASDASSAGVVNASLASDVSSRVGVLASLTTSNATSVTDAIKEIHRTGLAWHKIGSVTQADLTEAGNGVAEQEALTTIPAPATVADAMVYITTAFTGGGVVTCTIAVGIAANPDLFCEEHDCLGTGNTTWILEGQDNTDKGTGLYHVANTDRIWYTDTSAIPVICEFTPDGANDLAGLTTGDCDVWMAYYSASTS